MGGSDGAPLARSKPSACPHSVVTLLSSDAAPPRAQAASAPRILPLNLAEPEPEPELGAHETAPTGLDLQIGKVHWMCELERVARQEMARQCRLLERVLITLGWAAPSMRMEAAALRLQCAYRSRLSKRVVRRQRAATMGLGQRGRIEIGQPPVAAARHRAASMSVGARGAGQQPRGRGHPHAPRRDGGGTRAEVLGSGAVGGGGPGAASSAAEVLKALPGGEGAARLMRHMEMSGALQRSLQARAQQLWRAQGASVGAQAEAAELRGAHQARRRAEVELSRYRGRCVRIPRVRGLA
jgi:hypothetical protein